MYPWLQSQLNTLNSRLVTSSLHHALLLKGIKGIGKLSFAEKLAVNLLCNENVEGNACGQCQSCKLMVASSHPDFHVVESDKQIGVDLIREAIQKLLGKAQLSGNKVLIIKAADTLTESAANGLLKTLEEPTQYTYILMVSDNADRLLPTILSRCEKVNLQAPNAQQCIAWLAEQGIQQVDPAFLRFYSHAPLTLATELTKQDELTLPEFIQGLNDLQSKKISPIDAAVKWQDTCGQIIGWLQHILILQLKCNSKNETALLACMKVCLAANKTIRNPGVNKSLLLTGLLEPFCGKHIIRTEDLGFAS